MYPGSLPYALSLLVTAGLVAIGALYAFRHRSQAGAKTLGWLLSAMAVWCGMYAIEFLAPTLSGKVLAAKGKYLGIAPLGPLWFVFATQYTGRANWLTPRFRLLLIAATILTILLAFTNDAHHWIWTETSLDPDGFPELYVRHGPLFWVTSLLAYMLIIAGIVLLVFAYLRGPRLYRRQAGVMVLGALIPFVGNMLYLFNLVPLHGMDLTPFSFAFSGLVLLFGYYRFGLLDLIPVAATTVIHNLRDAVIVMDSQNRIVSFNPAAEKYLGTEEELLGRNLFQLLGKNDDLEATETSILIERGVGKNRRIFDLSISPLDEDCSCWSRRRVAVLRDITREHTLLEAERKYARQIELLNEITQAALQTTDLRQMLQLLADRLGELFEADGAYLTLWDEAKQQPIPMAAHKEFREEYPHLRPEPGERTLTQSVLELGHSLAIENTLNTPYFSHNIAKRFPPRSMLVLPLIADGKKLGAALIAYNQPYTFTPDEIALGEQTAAQIALAIAKLHLVEQLEQRAIEAETLRQATAAVVATLDPEKAIDRILVQLARVVPFDSAAIQLLRTDEDGKQYLEIVGGHGWPNPDQVLGLRLPIPGDNPNTRVIRQRRPLILNHPTAEYAIFREPLHRHIRSWLGVPLIVRERVLGMLAIDSVQPNFYTADHARLATAYADTVAIAIENAHLFRAEEQGRRALASLLEVMQMASASLEFKEVLKQIAQRTANICQANRCSIFLLSRDQEQLIPVMSQFADGHIDIEQWRKFRATAADRVRAVPLFYQAVEQRKPVQLDDPARTDLMPRHWLEPFGIQKLLLVPLLHSERVLGVLALDHTDPNCNFTAEQVELAQTIGAQVSSAIVNARLYAETKELAAELSVLLEVSTAISTHLELEQLLTEIARQTTHVLDGTSCYLCIWEPAQRALRVAAEYYGPDANPAERVSDLGVSYPLSQTNYQRLANNEDFVIHASQPDYDPEFVAHMQAYGGKTVLSVPLNAGGALFGELELWDSRTERKFSQEERRLARIIANQAAVAIQNVRLFEQQREQLRLSQTLQEIGSLLTTEMSLEEVMEHLFDLLERVVDYDSVSVHLRRASGKIEMVAARGVEDIAQVHQDVQTILSQDLQKVAWPNKAVMVIPDTKNHPQWQVYPSSKHIRSWIGAPLQVRGQVIGTLNVDSHTVNAYNEKMGEIVMAFANQAAVAIQNARLFEQQKEQLRISQTLQEIGSLLTTELSLEEVLERLMDLLGRVVDYDSVSIHLRQKDGRMALIAARGFPDLEQARQVVQDIYKNPLKQAILPIKQAQCVPDTYQDPHWVIYPGTEKIRSWVGAPLIVKGKNIGTLNVDSHTPNAYDAESIQIVTAFANQAAVAIYNARLADDLQRLARTDSLTGLANRRHLFNIAAREFERARRYGRPLAVLMFDLDHFKRVNDTYGHPVGDQVLREVAQRCQKALRKIDTLGRYGGEEFVAIMPEADLPDAQQAAERLRASVANEPILTTAGPIPITISVGVVALDDRFPDLPALLKSVDETMYLAKNSGRNRVCVQ